MQVDLDLERALRLQRRHERHRRLNRTATIFCAVAGFLAIAAVPGRAAVSWLIRWLA